MTAPSQVLKIRRPDDWHVHLRDGDMLKTVVPYTSEIYGRAIVMPNLAPPVTTVDAAIAYRQRILDAVPAGHDFTPLMTCYLTDTLDPDELERGFREGVFTAAKLYPANATTNSQPRRHLCRYDHAGTGAHGKTRHAVAGTRRSYPC
ncbi:dihydroorotase [Citrobacter koseri]|uniref:dihydroorotase n=1 Tax=Citrobacter koseri TaxID=545 RepID=A0A2X2VK66_CITKO|nr:dihydroorotase [Citrobacter koseri]